MKKVKTEVLNDTWGGLTDMPNDPQTWMERHYP